MDDARAAEQSTLALGRVTWKTAIQLALLVLATLAVLRFVGNVEIGCGQRRSRGRRLDLGRARIRHRPGTPCHSRARIAGLDRCRHAGRPALGAAARDVVPEPCASLEPVLVTLLVRRVRSAVAVRLRVWWPRVKGSLRPLRTPKRVVLSIGGNLATEFLFAAALGLIALGSSRTTISGSVEEAGDGVTDQVRADQEEEHRHDHCVVTGHPGSETVQKLARSVAERE
jgi:hypothetical protein